MNRTEWQTVHYYLACCEIAERNGFEIQQGEGEEIKIIALKKPYAKCACIARISGFYAAMKWLEGYEQKMFEIANIKE